MEQLRTENRELRGAVERLQSNPIALPAHTSRTGKARRAVAVKRPRIIDPDTDDEMEMAGAGRISPDLADRSEFPPLSTPSGERGGLLGITKDAHGGDKPATMGLSLGGKARSIEPIPSGLSEEDRAAMLRLREQRDNVLSQLNPILERLDALEVSNRDRNLKTAHAPTATAPIPVAVPPVIGKEAQASNPPGVQRLEGPSCGPCHYDGKTAGRREEKEEREERRWGGKTDHKWTTVGPQGKGRSRPLPTPRELARPKQGSI